MSYNTQIFFVKIAVQTSKVSLLIFKTFRRKEAGAAGQSVFHLSNFEALGTVRGSIH